MARFPDEINDREWVQKVAAMMKLSRVQVGKYRFTMPHPNANGQQHIFSSALHAIIYRWFDGDMAADELRSAVSHQIEDGPNAGMIPYITYWRGDGDDQWRQP